MTIIIIFRVFFKKLKIKDFINEKKQSYNYFQKSNYSGCIIILDRSEIMYFYIQKQIN